jgi:hypothetical protein
LLPLYVVAALVILLVFYALPLWLTFRAKRSFATGRLSQKKLVLLILPAGVMGMGGLIDFMGPFGLVSSFLHGVGGESGLSAYWVFVALNALLIYRAWSTYYSCREVPEG